MTKRSKFIEAIASALIEPQINRRSKIKSLPRELRKRANILPGVTAEPAQQEVPTGSRGICYECGRKREKTSRKYCSKRGHWIYGDHLKEICIKCYQN